MICWEPQQDNVLRDMWLSKDEPFLIATTLHRSVQAIMTRASRLGLPRRKLPGRKQRAFKFVTHKLKIWTSQDQSEERRSVHPVYEKTRRICLTCREPFDSEGKHNRLCMKCKGKDYSTP